MTSLKQETYARHIGSFSRTLGRKEIDHCPQSHLRLPSLPSHLRLMDNLIDRLENPLSLRLNRHLAQMSMGLAKPKKDPPKVKCISNFSL